jgi:hypothetical protein
MFKKLTLALTAFLFLLNGSISMAMNFSDVTNNYWAYIPINTLTEDKVISGYPDNTFKPENLVTRAEFATMLVKALNQEKLTVVNDLPYTDMNSSMWSYTDINRINDLKLVVGYPDNTFKPASYITKAEAMVVLANTLSGEYLDNDQAQNVMVIFKDKDSVPAWSTGAVSKSVQNDIYVKYPDPAILAANNQATRAEVADLLYKLRNNSSLLAKYKKQGAATVAKLTSDVSGIEHLTYIYSDKGINEVKVRRLQASIVEGNVLQTVFASDFNSKKASLNDKVQLTITEDLYTKEGTFLIPAGSIFEGVVSELQDAKLFNRNAKVGLNINKLILPCGKTYDMSAVIATESGLIESGYNKNNFKRDLITTLGTTAFGAGFGTLVSIDSNETGSGSIIGASSGAAIGLLGAAVVPGFSIDCKKGDKIYIKLVKDLTVNR